VGEPERAARGVRWAGDGSEEVSLGAAGVRAIQRGDALASSRLLERCQAMWRQPIHAIAPEIGDA